MEDLFFDPAPLVTLEDITALEEEMVYVTKMRNLIYFKIDAWNSRQKYLHQFLVKDEDLIFFLDCFKSAMIQHANLSVETSKCNFFRYLKAVSDQNVFWNTPDVCNLHYHANSLAECSGTLYCIHLHKLFSSNSNLTTSKSFKSNFSKRRRIRDVPLMSNFSMLFIFELHEDWSCCTGHEINVMNCRKISLNDCFYNAEYTSRNTDSRNFWHRMFDNEASLFTGDMENIATFVEDMKKRSKLKRVNVFDQIRNRELGEVFNKLMVLDTIVSPYYYLLPYQNKTEYEQFMSCSSWQEDKKYSEYIKISFTTFPLQISRSEILAVPSQF